METMKAHAPTRAPLKTALLAGMLVAILAAPALAVRPQWQPAIPTSPATLAGPEVPVTWDAIAGFVVAPGVQPVGVFPWDWREFSNALSCIGR